MNNSLIRAMRNTTLKKDPRCSIEGLTVDITLNCLPADATSLTLRLFTINFCLLSSDTIHLTSGSRQRKFHFDLRYSTCDFMESPLVVLYYNDEPWRFSYLMLINDHIMTVENQLCDFSQDDQELFMASRLWYRPCWASYRHLAAGADFTMRLVGMIKSIDQNTTDPLLVVGSKTQARVLATDVLGMYVAADQPCLLRTTSLDALRSGEQTWGEVFCADPDPYVVVVALHAIDGRGKTKSVLERLAEEAQRTSGQRARIIFHTSIDDLDDLKQYAPYMPKLFSSQRAIAIPDTEDEADDFDRLLKEFLEEAYEEPIVLPTKPDPNYKHLPFEISAADRLKLMVGLDRVKDEVEEARILALFAKERRALGLDATSECRNHMIFYGNPGTGKTTVAKLVGEMFHEMGLLSRGHTIEVNRSMLVGEYIGETEKKTADCIERARGGVLFIDEAYTLAVEKEGKDFGVQVINALLTVLSEPDPDLIVVLAGYEDKMQRLLRVNPGLLDRFPLKLHFEDYDAQQLWQIAFDFLTSLSFKLTETASQRLRQVMEQVVKSRDCYFGNGRWVHNFVEQGIVRALARRVMALDASERNAHLLSTIKESDVVEAERHFLVDAPRFSPAPRRIGFAM